MLRHNSRNALPGWAEYSSVYLGLVVSLTLIFFNKKMKLKKGLPSSFWALVFTAIGFIPTTVLENHVNNNIYHWNSILGD